MTDKYEQQLKNVLSAIHDAEIEGLPVDENFKQRLVAAAATDKLDETLAQMLNEYNFGVTDD